MCIDRVDIPRVFTPFGSFTARRCPHSVDDDDDVDVDIDNQDDDDDDDEHWNASDVWPSNDSISSATDQKQHLVVVKHVILNLNKTWLLVLGRMCGVCLMMLLQMKTS